MRGRSWKREDNEWVYRPEKVVEKYLEAPEDSDEPTCGPGPFSMASADTTSDILLGAGFEEVEFRRSDLPVTIGHDLDHAIAFTSPSAPPARSLRLQGDNADQVRPQIEADLRKALADFVQPDGEALGRPGLDLDRLGKGTEQAWLGPPRCWARMPPNFEIRGYRVSLPVNSGQAPVWSIRRAVPRAPGGQPPCWTERDEGRYERPLYVRARRLVSLQASATYICMWDGRRRSACPSTARAPRFAELRDHIEGRLSRAPRYRQGSRACRWASTPDLGR